LYERLNNDEERRCATSYHFLNDFISQTSFDKLREEARRKDEDIIKLN